MLHIICGRKGVGKTTCLHRQLFEKIKETDAKVILLVPKHFTFDTDKSVLDIMGPRYASNVDVLSFSRLALTVMKTLGGTNKPVLGDGANAAVMGLALDSVKDKLTFFSRHYNNISFIKKMVNEVGSLKQQSVSPSLLAGAAGKLPDGLLKRKMSETVLIYEAYNALVAESFFDDRDMLTLVADVLSRSDFFKGKTVAIDNFTSFSGQERAIIEQMLKEADDVYLTALSDNLENTDISSPFAVVNDMVRKIRSLAEKNFCRVRKPIYLTAGGAGLAPCANAQLSYLEENLFSSDAEPYAPECEEESACVHLVEAADARQECDFVARRIKGLIRQEKYRCRDIAVVYRNAEPYEKLMRSSLKKYGVPIFEDKRQPIENEPLMIAVGAVLDICANGFSTERLMRYMKTGLTEVGTEETARLENYALMWDLGAKEWQKDFTENPDGFGVEMNEERKIQLALINETRKKIVEPIAGLKNRLCDGTAKENITAVYQFLIDNHINEKLKDYAILLEDGGNVELALEQEQVWDILMNVFDKLAGVLGERTVSPKRLLELFILVVSTESLGQLPNGFDEVYITGSDRVQTKTSKVTFVVGLNSGLFPSVQSPDGLFGETEKVKIETVLPDVYDTGRRTAQNERLMAYVSLASAKEELYLSFSLVGKDGEKLTESEIVTTVRKLFPSADRISTSLEPIDALLESENAAFQLMAERWNEESPEAETLRLYFADKPEYKGKIEAIRRATSRKPFAFEDKKTAERLVGSGIRLSASRLEDYEECPFRYFCKHEIRAKPRKTAKLDPSASGTLVHYVLEKLLKKHKGERLYEISPEEIDKELEQLLSDYIDTYMGGMSDKTKRFNYLYNRTLKILRVIVSRLSCEFSESDFEPCDFELKIDRDGEIKPFRLELENGYIELRGIIDRVDKMDKNGNRYIRVVDYKTGPKSFSLSDVLDGLGMQMLLYLVSIWRNGKDYYGDNIVPSGVLYLPARFTPYAVDRDDEDKVRNEKKLSGGKMDGMILDDGVVLEGMDRSRKGQFIPIKISKKGALSGTFINLEQLGKLSHLMDETMKEMGNSLHNGFVPAKPVFGKNHSDTCQWCDYKSVCMRKPGDEVRYIRSMNHSQCLTILDGGGENEEKLDG